VLATALTLGVSELVASISRDLRSPVVDVGSRVIDAAPRWLKDVAIRSFGARDKDALVIGIGVLLIAYAIVIGIAATRRRWIAPFGVLLFAIVGVLASAGGPAGVWSIAPTVLGAVAGGVALWVLARHADEERPVAAAGVGRPSTRRSFLALGATVGVAAIAAGGIGRWLSRRFDVDTVRAALRLPRASRPLPQAADDVSFDIPGLTPFRTRPAAFYRVDTAISVPQVPIDSWRLHVGGMVDRPLTLSFDELTHREVVEADITLTCVSNEVGGHLAGTTRWRGVRLDDLLREARPRPGADQVVGRSTDGFTAGFPLVAAADGRDALIAFGMDGDPLPVEHGFPARLIVPGLYGYVSATKWLTDIELTRFDRFEAYWAARGWSTDAPIKTFSRIDTPAPLSHVSPGRHPIAGVAWAQGRGVDRVEIRIDGGAWRVANLASELNDVTWRQWMLAVDLSSGRHTIECRATDRTGAIQPERRSEPFPDGATGWHSVVVLVD
jgi:DMSO/TMAO reductase YedYZ molybdopterin-dependent catalytic subunit